jgi:hypothetical protein
MRNIKYQDLIDLGFKRDDYTDNVVFKETGYHPYFLSKKLGNGISLEYLQEEGNVILQRVDEQQRIKGTIKCDDISEVKMYLNFFGKEASHE